MTQVRRFKKKWLLLGFVCCGAVIFHQPLLLLGCKIALKNALPSGTYDTLQWENGVIALSGLVVKDSSSELMVDRIELKFAGDFFDLRFAPKVTVVHPQVVILDLESQESANPIFLYRTRFFQPVWTITNGVLQLPASRFYFSAVPSEEPATSRLNISYDPDLLAAPMLSAEMAMKEGKLEMGFKLQERDLGRLLPLAALIGAPREWDNASGEIEMEGLISFSKSLEIEALHVQGLGKEIILSSPKMGFKLLCDDFKGFLSFPDMDMQLDAGGALLQENSQLQFSLFGKGGVQDDATLWSETTLALTSSDGSEMQSVISLCSLEGADLAVHAKIDNITPSHMNFISGMRGSLGECVEGVVSGEATLLYKEGRWQSLSVEKCTLDKVRWSFPQQEIMVFSESGNFTCDAVFSSQGIDLKILGDELFFLNPQGEFCMPKGDRPMQFSYDASSKKWRGEIPLAQADLRHKDLGLSLQNIEGNLIWEEKHLLAPSLYAECEGLALTGDLDLDLANAQLNISTSQIAGDVKSLLSIMRKFHPLPADELLIHGNFSSDDKGFVLSRSLNPSGDSVEWSFKGRFDGLNFPINKTTRVRDASCLLAMDSKSKSLSVVRGEGIWELEDGTPLNIELKRFIAAFFDQRTVDFALAIGDGKKEFAELRGVATQSLKSAWDIAFEKMSTHLVGTELNINKCILSQDTISLDMNPVLKCQDLPLAAAFLRNTGFLPSTFSPENLEEWQLEGTLATRVSSEDMRQGFSFQLESHDLKVKGEPIASFRVAGQKVGEKWQIEKLHAGALDLKGAIVSDVDGFSSPGFEGTWNGLALKGSGLLKTQKKRFSCILESVKGDFSVLKVPNAPKGTFITAFALTGDFSSAENPLMIVGEANVFADLQSPLQVTASNRQAIKFTYNKTGGLTCSGIDLQLKHKLSGAYVAELQASKVLQSNKGLNFQQVQFHVTPALWGYAIDAKILPYSFKELAWEGDLELSGDLQVSPSGPVFLGNLKPGMYGYEEKKYPFEQVQLRYEKDLFSIKAKTQIEELPLWASFQMDLSKEPLGMLKLYDHPKSEGLKILFRAPDSKIAIESIQGSCYGLNCSLVKSSSSTLPLASVLKGDIKVDSDRITYLFPRTIREGIQNLKLGGGYQWAGDLVLFQDAKKGFSASGTLTGKDFEFFGYRFHRLESLLEASRDSAVFSNLKIEDPSGSIRIKDIELKKKTDWNLFIPQVLVKDLQPSLMQKVGAEPSSLKPFTIKNFTLSDIRFRLGDKSSLEGSGQLMFVNQYKKGSSIFDAPLEMIKKLGLDLGILTPVQGEIQVELRGDKFYLVSLDNSFSEGNRSEFYLFPEKNLSYIDLDGKMHIDLKMRQDVVLKLAEPFTLTIRGTLENPRYGLQF